MTRALRVAGVVAVLGVGASGCPLLHAYTQKPDVKLQKVDVTNVDFQGANLEALLQVTNKVPVGITIGKISWGVSLEGNKLVAGELTNGLTIDGKATAPVKVPFALKFEDLFKISQKYKDQDTAPYRLEGTMAIDTPIGPVTIPFHHDGTVPVLKIPEVDLARVEVRGVNLLGADVRLSFHVRARKFSLNGQSSHSHASLSSKAPAWAGAASGPWPARRFS